MAQKTIIAWTDATWNPVHGCSKISPGCAHCYAAELSLRYGWTKKPWVPANAAENVMLKPHKLYEPLSTRKPFGKPCMIFVNSMSDLFHEEIPFEYIDQIFAVMALAKQHTFQVLTKRPERMLEYFRYKVSAEEELTLDSLARGGQSWGGQLWHGTTDRVRTAASQIAQKRGLVFDDLDGWPLPNVWLGVSIENRRFVHRADVLRLVPAAIHWISAEPLIGPLFYDSDMGYARDGMDDVPEHLQGDPYEPCWLDGADLPQLDLTDLDWVVVGGESGPGYRKMNLQWAQAIWDNCRDAGVPFFFKQNHGPRTEMGIDALGQVVREYPT